MRDVLWVVQPCLVHAIPKKKNLGRAVHDETCQTPTEASTGISFIGFAQNIRRGMSHSNAFAGLWTSLPTSLTPWMYVSQHGSVSYSDTFQSRCD